MNGLNCAVLSAAAVEQVGDAGNSTITVFYLSDLFESRIRGKEYAVSKRRHTTENKIERESVAKQHPACSHSLTCVVETLLGSKISRHPLLHK